jgi:hypothetical protein
VESLLYRYYSSSTVARRHVGDDANDVTVCWILLQNVDELTLQILVYAYIETNTIGNDGILNNLVKLQFAVRRVLERESSSTTGN